VLAGQKRRVSCSQCVSDRTPPSATVPIGNSGAGTRGIRRVRSRSFRADPYVVTEAAASGQRPTQGMRVRVGPNSRGEDGHTRAEHFPPSAGRAKHAEHARQRSVRSRRHVLQCERNTCKRASRLVGGCSANSVRPDMGFCMVCGISTGHE